MTFTVEQVIALDVVQLARPKLVAGHAGLGATVRWVHISDFPEIATGLHGGELLITAGSRIKDNPQAQRRFIASLVDAGVAGVLLEAGDHYQVVPSALEIEAERYGLPLILLREPTPYVDITERVHASIVNSRYDELQMMHELSRDLTELALEGARPRQIVWRLFETIGRPIVLEDSAHNLIECAAPENELGSRMESWSSHAHLEHCDRPDLIGSGVVPGECEWTNVNVRGQQWGRLHVLTNPDALMQTTQLQLDICASTLALTVAGIQEATSWADHERSVLLQDMIRGSARSRDELVARARHLGVPLDKGILLVLTAESCGNRGASIRSSGRPSTLLRAVRRVLDKTGIPGICSDHEGEVVLLAVLRASDAGDAERRAALLAEKIRREAGSTPSASPVTIGYCVGLGLGAVREAVGRAEIALRYGMRTSDSGGVHNFSQLGFQQVLLRLGDGPELGLLVEAELGPVLTHDARTAGTLTDTLRVFLAAPSATEAARTLNLQRRSLYHRLDKVRDLLSCDLHDPGTRVRLIMALEVRAYLQDASAQETLRQG